MRKLAGNSRRCCCARQEPASKAAPTRSCATSSPSACSDCPATSGSTRMFRSTRYRPGEETNRHSPMCNCTSEDAPFGRRPGIQKLLIEIPGSRWRAPRNDREKEAAMNFDDTPQEAAFRAEARKWIDANAPKEFEAELSKCSLGRIRLEKGEIVDVGKAWQKKKAEAGWACIPDPGQCHTAAGSPPPTTARHTS